MILTRLALLFYVEKGFSSFLTVGSRLDTWLVFQHFPKRVDDLFQFLPSLVEQPEIRGIPGIHRRAGHVNHQDPTVLVLVGGRTILSVFFIHLIDDLLNLGYIYSLVLLMQTVYQFR